MGATGRELLGDVVVPVVTTMDAGRKPEAGGMERLLDELTAARVTKIMIFGSNGEGPVLGEGELASFAEGVSLRWRERVPHGALFINVSGVSTDDSMRRTRAIMSAEPDAIVLSPPMYFRHSRQDIVEHYRAFSSFGVPVVAYNSPSYTGNDLDLEVTADLLELDHVVGMKDSSKAPGRIGGLVETSSVRADFGVSQGDEAGLAQALADGANGITPGIANLAPTLAVDMVDSWRAGDTARGWEAQESIRALTGIHGIRPGIATTKAALRLRGVCEGYVSRPFVEYSDGDLRALSEFLRPWDDVLVGAST